jgi:hypothetical protein
MNHPIFYFVRILMRLQSLERVDEVFLVLRVKEKIFPPPWSGPHSRPVSQCSRRIAALHRFQVRKRTFVRSPGSLRCSTWLICRQSTEVTAQAAVIGSAHGNTGDDPEFAQVDRTPAKAWRKSRLVLSGTQPSSGYGAGAPAWASGRPALRALGGICPRDWGNFG